jgi:hypothetical protein
MAAVTVFENGASLPVLYVFGLTMFALVYAGAAKPERQGEHMPPIF